ncbi:TetR/AcrR family transcriptional regulator [Rubrivirga sp. IMCC43871]|uniref:TetR/AcrR family transcriptional regulator n=1 Tax=Rubrivirga sp. IMCC43871 TaxID=3391575 RepID=UPI00398FAB64
MNSPRPYRQTARAEAAAQTGRDILAAAAALWRERSLDAITLADIAERAGVSVQTVIRRFGSKDGVIDAGIEARASGVEAERDAAPVDDVAGALDVLLAHYEADGDAVVRTLALEDRLPAAKRIADNGRAHHRAWCARVFGHVLPAPDAADHTARLDAVVAATDLYVWKLLRRDLGRSVEATRAAFDALLGPLVT